MKKRILNFQVSIFNYQFTPGGLMGHPLFSGSAIMIIGSNFANLFAYLYHLIIGRMLGPSLFGELAATISLIGMFTISFNFLGLVIVKFVSAAKKEEQGNLLGWFFRKAVVLGLVVGFISLAAVPLASSFLNIESNILILIAPILFFSVMGLVFKSFFHGLLKFKEVTILTNFEILARLLLGVALVALGFSVFGAVFGMLIAAVGALLLSLYYLKRHKITVVKNRFDGGRKVLVYTIPIFVSSLATNSFFSSDLLLVKHFFSPHDAGIYASMSALGKIIFFGTAPVSAVMFPMISKRHAKGHGYKKIFLLSLGLVSIIAFGVLLVYYFFPELMVNILYGDEFIDAAQDLVWFGLFMAIFSLSSLITSFFLSTGKTKIVYFVLLAAALQVAGIWIFHSSIIEVIKVSIITSSLLLVSLFLYFFYDAKANFSNSASLQTRKNNRKRSSKN